jgi:hypothetical protein
MGTLVNCAAALIVAGGFASSAPAVAQPLNAQASAPVASGVVVGPDSKPQAGVPIVVQGPHGKTVAYTDANGKWSLYNLPPGDYQVQPVPGAAASSGPVSFTVKQPGLFDKLLGSPQQQTFTGSEIKLDKAFKQ